MIAEYLHQQISGYWREYDMVKNQGKNPLQDNDLLNKKKRMYQNIDDVIDFRGSKKTKKDLEIYLEQQFLHQNRLPQDDFQDDDQDDYFDADDEEIELDPQQE
jgi:hypothetical protein